ncbi:FAD-dependent oxidoreductase [Rugosimonospora africana]|uniref:FAD-dependent oxidoreductase n=1 Tax=Rugosimonospora africana TaxID=556532 RepID=UPI001EF29908|nr:FAD-dependent oxidoreductase [Rugosimonospora africana]
MKPEIRSEVLVIGAGVSGLTTALTLARAKVPVRVVADRQPKQSTSCAAGAIWGPYLVSHDHIKQWSEESYNVLYELAERQSRWGEPTGVRMVAGIEASRAPDLPPDWATQLDGFRMCSVAELPDGFVSGWRYTSPVVDMPMYLDYLVTALEDLGCTVETGHVASLDDAAAQATVTVNCTGFGAHRLVPDDELTPVRGQLAVAENPGLKEFFAEYSEEADDLIYFLPQGDRVVLGGSAEPGEREMDCNPDTIAGIVRRCAEIEPRLRGVRVLDRRVGIRPSRPVVRVEHVRFGERHVIHNYGHGGAGVSLSWGCASEIRDIVLDVIMA